MKIIEAMKKVKANRAKVIDLQEKIAKNSAHLSHETSAYVDPKAKIASWSQSCLDLTQESAKLLTAISRTNLETMVTIDIGGKPVRKSIAEWIWRRREFATTDRKTFASMTDRNLKEGVMVTSTEQRVDVKLVRNYDVEVRDAKMSEFSEEPDLIDSHLEVVNAITDIIE